MACASCAHTLPDRQKAREHLTWVQARKDQDLRYVARKDLEAELEKNGSWWVVLKGKWNGKLLGQGDCNIKSVRNNNMKICEMGKNETKAEMKKLLLAR